MDKSLINDNRVIYVSIVQKPESPLKKCFNHFLSEFCSCIPFRIKGMREPSHDLGNKFNHTNVKAATFKMIFILSSVFLNVHDSTGGNDLSHLSKAKSMKLTNT